MSSAYSVSSGMKDAETGGFGIGWFTRVTGMPVRGLLLVGVEQLLG